MMILDISDTTGLTGIDFLLLWELLMIVQVISVWILFPILIVYYESNENDGLVRRMVQMSYQLPFRERKLRDLCR
jgi:hypothetical protein